MQNAVERLTFTTVLYSSEHWPPRTKLDCIKGLVACRQHVINRMFTSSNFGPHGVVDRAVGRAYRIKRLGVEYWAKCHFDCATADYSQGGWGIG